MLQQQGSIDNDNPHYVCKLHKAIYGLNQAPRAWYHEFRQLFVTSGFTNLYADTSLVALNDGGTLFYLFVYIDDIIITGDNAGAIHKFIKLLSQYFRLRISAS